MQIIIDCVKTGWLKTFVNDIDCFTQFVGIPNGLHLERIERDRINEWAMHDSFID